MFRMKNKSLSGVDRTKIFRNAGTYIVLGLALGAMTFFGVCDPGQGLRGPQGSAARIGDEVISRGEFSLSYDHELRQHQQRYGADFKRENFKVARNVMDRLIDSRLLYIAATDIGLKASEGEAVSAMRESAIFKDEEEKFNPERFSNYLRYTGYNEAQALEEFRRQVTLQEFYTFVAGNAFVSTKAAEIDYKLTETKIDVEYIKMDYNSISVRVSDQEAQDFLKDDSNKSRVENYYKSNKQDYSQKEELKARHILVGFEGARSASAEARKRKKEQAKVRAERLLSEVKKSGADFASIAKKETDEAAGKTSGGDLGWFSRDKMVKEFSDAAFALKPGQISGVIESPFGFHIIKVEDHKAAKEIPLAQAQQEIARKLLIEQRKPKELQARAEAIIKALKEGGDVDGLLRKYGLSWKKTGETAINSRYIAGIGSDRALIEAVHSLKRPGDFHPEILSANDAKFIVRLASRKEADMKKFDEKKQQELTDGASRSLGFQLLSAFQKETRDRYEKAKKIHRNASYLALDNPPQQPQE